MRLDPDEMILFALLEEGNSLAHEGISDDYARLRFRMRTRRVEGRHDGIEIVAVDPAHEPAERLKFIDQRLEPHHLLRGPIGLLVVDVDDCDQIVELVVRRRHHRFPF